MLVWDTVAPINADAISYNVWQSQTVDGPWELTGSTTETEYSISSEPDISYAVTAVAAELESENSNIITVSKRCKE